MITLAELRELFPQEDETTLQEVLREARRHIAMPLKDVLALVLSRDKRFFGFFQCEEAFAREVARRSKVNPVLFAGTDWQAFARGLLETGYTQKGGIYYVAE